MVKQLEKAVCALLGLLLMPLAHGEDYIALSAGADIDGPAKMGRIIYRHELKRQFVLNSGRRFNTFLEASTGTWKGGVEHAKRNYSLGLKYVVATGLADSQHTFVEFGIGPVGITERMMDGETNMGYHLQFDSHIGITHFFSSNKFISYRLQHLSNGGLDEINPGMNFQTLTIGFEL